MTNDHTDFDSCISIYLSIKLTSDQTNYKNMNLQMTDITGYLHTIGYKQCIAIYTQRYYTHFI